MKTPKTGSSGPSQVASSGAIVVGRSSGGMPSTRTPPQTISSTRIAEGYSSLQELLEALVDVRQHAALPAQVAGRRLQVGRAVPPHPAEVVRADPLARELVQGVAVLEGVGPDRDQAKVAREQHLDQHRDEALVPGGQDALHRVAGGALDGRDAEGVHQVVRLAVGDRAGVDLGRRRGGGRREAAGVAPSEVGVATSEVAGADGVAVAASEVADGVAAGAWGEAVAVAASSPPSPPQAARKTATSRASAVSRVRRRCGIVCTSITRGVVQPA